MLFKTHIVFSLAVYFLLSYFIEMPWYVLIFVLLATAFVDIDIKNSRAGNRWYLRPFQIFTKHRGMLHSLFIGLLLSLVIASISQWAGVGFFVGYISHLFLDCLTRSGVALFWPFSWKIKGFVKSGGIMEQVVFVLLLLGDIFVVGKWFFYYLV
ncbi:MAG: metal-dependent hydrolase [Nanoarchaeota archaeon]|nr:metal-dependent hydrolase [Nanoarchaeota archaeon]